MKVYTHNLGKEVRFISGHYEIIKEGRLHYQGREVLYAVGNAVVDNSCCGVGGCRYAVVPGFVLKWLSGTDPEGLPTTEVEPIEDEKAKAWIRDYLEREEFVSQVQFW